MKKYYLILLIILFIELPAFSLTKLAGGSCPGRGICLPAAGNPYLIDSFHITQLYTTVILDTIKFRTLLSYAASDIVVFTLYKSNSITMTPTTGATPIDFITTGTGFGPHAFHFTPGAATGLPISLNAGTTTYFWITASINTPATPCDSFQVDVIDSADLVVTGGVIGIDSVTGFVQKGTGWGLDTYPTIHSITMSDTLACKNGCVSLIANVSGCSNIYSWTGHNYPGAAPYGITGDSSTVTICSLQTTNAGYFELKVFNPVCAAIDSGFSTDTLRISTLPTISITLTNDTICAGPGAFTTLYGDVVGGSTTGVTYLWVPPSYSGRPNNAHQNLTFGGPINTADSGLYTFKVFVLGCPDPVIASANLVVDTIPVIDTFLVNPNPICNGQTLTLRATEQFGSSWEWIGKNSTVFLLDSVLDPTPFSAYITTDSGLYTFGVQNFCGIARDSVYVVILPNPGVITGSDTVVCQGSFINLSDSTLGGIWSSSNSNATVSPISGTETIITGIHPGRDTITFTTYGLCKVSVPITIGKAIDPLPGPIPICQLQDTLLTHTTTGGVWSTSATGLLTVGATTGLVVGLEPTPTTGSLVTYTTPGCPPSTTTIIVNTNPKPITGDSVICSNGGTITVSDLTAGGVWSLSNHFHISLVANGTNEILVAHHAGYDTLFYTQTNPPKCGTFKVIKVDSVPEMIVLGADSICFGQCAWQRCVKKADSSKLYEARFRWINPIGINDTVSDTVLACPLETQIYTVIVTTKDGCHPTKPVGDTLVVKHLPVLTYAQDPFFICRGTSGQIQTFGADHYAWYPNVFISNDSIANPFFSDTLDLVYVLTGTTAGLACTDSIKIPVSVLDSTVTGITPDTIICIGDTIQLDAYNSKPKGMFEWYTVKENLFMQPADSLRNDTLQMPFVYPTKTTEYAVIITENACFKDTQYVNVIVDPLPALLITVTGQVPLIAGGTDNLTVTVTNGDTAAFWNWVAGETIGCPICQTTAVTPTTTTTYSVTVTTNRGCVSTDSVTVHIICDRTQVFIPNTFTPNGDGVNDRFYVSGKGLGLITEMTIFNRWGQQVFEAQNIPANDPAYGWDGTYKGQIVPPDVFMYVIKVQCETYGAVFSFNGDISLLR